MTSPDITAMSGASVEVLCILLWERQRLHREGLPHVVLWASALGIPAAKDLSGCAVSSAATWRTWGVRNGEIELK